MVALIIKGNSGDANWCNHCGRQYGGSLDIENKAFT